MRDSTYISLHIVAALNNLALRLPGPSLRASFFHAQRAVMPWDYAIQNSTTPIVDIRLCDFGALVMTPYPQRYF